MTDRQQPRGPLSHLRVISVAEQYPGPYATLLLSDLGADVIQVERPDGGDPTRSFPPFHTALARGKRSVVLDLKAPAGRAEFVRMIVDADILFEGFRPGAMGRLGLDYDALRAHNPRLIYVSVSGFGQDGPYRDRPGHDLCYQAAAGMLYPLLDRPGPHRPPDVAIGDLSAGLLAALGALAALADRDRTGGGHYVDVSMFDGLVSLLTAHLAPVASSGAAPGFPYEPGYGIFETADGRLISLGVAHEDHFWTRLCDVVGLTADRHLTSTQRFADADRLAAQLRAAMAGAPLAHWVQALASADVPFSTVNRLNEVLDDPHVLARGLVVPVAGATGTEYHVRQPLRIDGIGYGPTRPAPTLGEHTADVLADRERV